MKKATSIRVCGFLFAIATFGISVSSMAERRVAPASSRVDARPMASNTNANMAWLSAYTSIHGVNGAVTSQRGLLSTKRPGTGTIHTAKPISTTSTRTANASNSSATPHRPQPLPQGALWGAEHSFLNSFALSERAYLSAVERHRRKTMAKMAVAAELSDWIEPHRVTLRAARVASTGDTRNPITGAGPVKLYAEIAPPTGASWLTRVAHRFRGISKLEYLVSVDAKGSAQVEQETTLAPQNRLWRAFQKYVPVKEMASDFAMSRGVQVNLVPAIAGLVATATVSPMLGIPIVTLAAKEIWSGMKRRREARRDVLKLTVDWIQQEQVHAQEHGINDVSLPTIREAYDKYVMLLEEHKPGTLPWKLETFWRKLALYDL